MQQYIIRRLIQVIPTLIGASILVFLLMRVIPGDVTLLIAGPDSWASEADRAQMKAQLGLDKPLWEQPLTWASGLAHLDVGNSLWSRLIIHHFNIGLPAIIRYIRLCVTTNKEDIWTGEWQTAWPG